MASPYGMNNGSEIIEERVIRQVEYR